MHKSTSRIFHLNSRQQYKLAECGGFFQMQKPPYKINRAFHWLNTAIRESLFFYFYPHLLNINKSKHYFAIHELILDRRKILLNMA